MEPLDDKELSSLLREWKAPARRPACAENFLRPRQTWAQWLTKGSLRIPVPVALLAAIAILAVWLVAQRQPAEVPIAQPVGASTLADFQPVQQLEPRIIESSQENDDAPRK
jgi:hypothetical protein